MVSFKISNGGKPMTDSEKVRELTLSTGCSMQSAKKTVVRHRLCKELRHDESLSDAVDTFIRILNFEFGGDYDA